MTNYYDAEKNAREYIDMAEGHDGSELIEVLKNTFQKQLVYWNWAWGPGKISIS